MTFAMISVGFTALWLTISYRRRLLHPEVTTDQVRRQTRRVLLGAPAFTIAALIALWSPRTSVAADAVLALAYLLPAQQPARSAAA